MGVAETGPRPEVRLGPGVVEQLPELLGEARRVFVVHGVRSFRAGAAAAVVDALGGKVRSYGGVRPNPVIEQVRAAVALARADPPDAVVGIGGGSAMDVAKCVAVLAGCDGDPEDYLRNPAELPARRASTLVQVPTIAGSGSELTRFATVYVGRRKYSLDHPSARADHVLIDPEFAATVPVSVAAASALDAFSQAVESAWAVAATPESTQLAFRAVRELGPVFATALRRGSFADPVLRLELARGAASAGAAIDISRTTAAHALAYTLTAEHNITHGAAVGLHLRWLVGHNGAATEHDSRHPGGAAAVRRVVRQLQDACADAAGMSLETLIDRLLTMHGITEFDLPDRDWREDLAGGRAANNPRLVTAADVPSRPGRA